MGGALFTSSGPGVYSNYTSVDGYYESNPDNNYQKSPFAVVGATLVKLASAVHITQGSKILPIA